MTKQTDEETLRKILALRADSDEVLPQRAVAERLGVSQQLVSKLERQAGAGRRRKRKSFADSATGMRATPKDANEAPGEPQDELELLGLLAAMDADEDAP